MNPDFTQQQSLGGLEKAEQLSLQSTLPPAEVEGFKIEKLLGQGAFGQVWLGCDLNTGRQVAIKFYLYRGGINFQLLNREVKHLVNMSTGRYIVQVLGVGWEANPPYYVMEFLENGSLEDMVRARGSLSIPETVSMLREIAEGLSYAHGKGVLHCDLKPANVMLDHDWRPRLADFGQSRMSDEQTPSLGTLFFMAPEQADLSASPDAAWDVYALGAIAYCMLVGSPPYRTPEVVETLDTADSLPDRLKRYRETIRQAPRPRLHYRRKGIDKSLCQIVDRCLTVKPENRFANVQQVIGALNSRDRARTRRPLFLLGIIGPILLLMLLLFFSDRSRRVAEDRTLAAVQASHLKTNKFASQMAAVSLAAQFENLFRAVEEESRSRQLRQLLAKVSEAGSKELDVIALGKESTDENASAKQEFVAMSERLELQAYIANRLEEMIRNDKGKSSAAIFNSLFVDDTRGNNLATHFSVLEDDLTQSPVGRNFAYRTYFTGLPDDASKDVPRSTFEPIRHPHLSAAFQSSATGKYKVGVSAPIWESEEAELRAESGNTEVRPIGVLVLTINLGDFDLLAGENGEELAQFAALVDGRPGNGQGTLLQHPFLKLNEQSGDDRISRVPQISPKFIPELLGREGVVNYKDPFAELPGGAPFDGEWLAAMNKVEVLDSNLWVLVQERSSSVSQPVRSLGVLLRRESYIAVFVLVVVVAVLWYFVFWLGRTSLSNARRTAAANANSAYGSTGNSGP